MKLCILNVVQIVCTLSVKFNRLCLSLLTCIKSHCKNLLYLSCTIVIIFSVLVISRKYFTQRACVGYGVMHTTFALNPTETLIKRTQKNVLYITKWSLVERRLEMINFCKNQLHLKVCVILLKYMQNSNKS